MFNKRRIMSNKVDETFQKLSVEDWISKIESVKV